MERRRRTGGERGGRGMEENTMAILDTFGFSNSKISHHLDDDRASCFSGSSENLFFPIMEVHLREMCEAIFRILKDALDLIIESYQLLVKLDKVPSGVPIQTRTSRFICTFKGYSQVIMVEEAWVPFNSGLDSYNEKGAATNHSGSSIDSSGFHALIHEIAEVFKGTKSEGNETTFLKNMLLLQYLISVLEGDFIPRNCAYHGSFCRDREKLCTKVVNIWNLKDYSCAITVPTYEALESVCAFGSASPFVSCLSSFTQKYQTHLLFSLSQLVNAVLCGYGTQTVLLFEQKSSDLAVSSKKEEVKRGFTSAMMLPLGQGLLCATVDQQFLIYSVDKHADGGLNLFMRT
ncbi:isoform X1 [Orobanche hederae]